ncbi:hypothetical protein BDW22DRAFT_1117499 [Trametopsis cervina]|nr:hypothetical protein BDW22DRAFT_1117499 [Trametopsis cervina]
MILRSLVGISVRSCSESDQIWQANLCATPLHSCSSRFTASLLGVRCSNEPKFARVRERPSHRRLLPCSYEADHTPLCCTIALLTAYLSPPKSPTPSPPCGICRCIIISIRWPLSSPPQKLPVYYATQSPCFVAALAVVYCFPLSSCRSMDLSYNNMFSDEMRWLERDIE